MPDRTKFLLGLLPSKQCPQQNWSALPVVNTLTLVNPEILSLEITEATGLKLVSVTETAASAANPDTIASSWFITFLEDNKASLPVRLSLFGMITDA